MTDTFEDEIRKVARSVATKAAADACDLSESTEALKVLTQYYALRLKHRENTDDEDDTFDGIAGRLADIDKQEEPNGRTPRVRSRARRSDA